MTKMRVFSGIQPTGNLHLGNYLGAIKNFVALQATYECLYCVVDLHAITVLQNPTRLRQNVLSTVAAFLSCGVNPYKSNIFIQSNIPQHTELHWILTTITKLGWLNRMTQFKAKAGMPDPEERFQRLLDYCERILDVRNNGTTQHRMEEILDEMDGGHLESIATGLYMYPVLMAADILLYKATHVPVGDDQKQHLQLARQVARSFNHQVGDLFFPEPQDIVPEIGARIMSLRYPERKMSKSSMESEEEVIFLTDTADQITKKIKRATTDTDMLPSEPLGLEGRLGAKNLVTIYALSKGCSLEEACQELGGQGFGNLKKKLTEVLVETIVPIGNEIGRITNDPSYIKTVLLSGADKANHIAEDTMISVRKMVGVDLE